MSVDAYCLRSIVTIIDGIEFGQYIVSRQKWNFEYWNRNHGVWLIESDKENNATWIFLHPVRLERYSGYRNLSWMISGKLVEYNNSLLIFLPIKLVLWTQPEFFWVRQLRCKLPLTITNLAGNFTVAGWLVAKRIHFGSLHVLVGLNVSNLVVYPIPLQTMFFDNSYRWKNGLTLNGFSDSKQGWVWSGYDWLKALPFEYNV